MQTLSTMTRNEDTVIVTHHRRRVDPTAACATVLRLQTEKLFETPVELGRANPRGLGKIDSEPEDPETAEKVAYSQQIVELKVGVEVLQGPWASTQDARNYLAPLIDDVLPEFHYIFGYCDECWDGNSGRGRYARR